MNNKPGILNIILNDSWAAPVLGGFVMALSATTIVLVTNPLVGHIRTINPTPFFWMTGISFSAFIFTNIHRVRTVTQVFENGIVLKAQVIESRPFRSTLRMKLRYTYLAQTHERKLEQVITGKTRKLLFQEEVMIVVDQADPKRILLRDAYL